MNKRIIECVPNFSEGKDLHIIKLITDAIESVEGVKLLNVDPGEATNRTVVTFAGEPEAVCEAAFRGAVKAKELIDMRKHHGAHPRMGATDVLPLIPVEGITLEETAELALKLGQRLAEEASIPVYAYEASARKPERRNLAVCRKGEYEALEKRFGEEKEKPDFGPEEFTEEVARSGATAVGARDFLIAVNFNLNTTSTRRANAIAFDVREKGRPQREGNTVTGKPVKDENGKPVMIPGTLKATKAIGWYIDEYKMAQVSMNITDINTTPLHIAFDEICRKADGRGVRVTGTELVGLVPKRVMIEAGKYFLKKQQRSTGISDREIIDIAAQSMGLSQIQPWNPEERIIEYLLEEKSGKLLIGQTLKEFAENTASESPAPGGGSVSAYMGALGAALGCMVANLSSHKPGWDEKWEYFSEYAESMQQTMQELLLLVDEDTNSFNKVMECFRMPKSNDKEKAAYEAALEEATLYATDIPFRTMRKCAELIPLLYEMTKSGNPNSLSDAGVGLHAIRAALHGAYMNVVINARTLKDEKKSHELQSSARELLVKSVSEIDSITLNLF